MSSPRFRLSTNYNRFYAGHTHNLAFRVYEWDDDPTVRAWVPLALGSFTSVLFQVYDNDSATSLLWSRTLTVQSAAGELEGGIANKATGTIQFAAAAARVRCKVVLNSSGTYRVAGEQWEADVYVGGPTS